MGSEWEATSQVAEGELPAKTEKTQAGAPSVSGKVTSEGLGVRRGPGPHTPLLSKGAEGHGRGPSHLYPPFGFFLNI